MDKIPVWEKYMLTQREASEYFHIGESKLRKIIEDNNDANFVLMCGNRAMIKRELFAEFLNAATVI